MENASKALLIAGAILICIVLISLGMLIVNSSSEVTDQVSDITTDQAVSTFNSTFSNYAGTQKGSAIKTLLQSLSTNNATQNNTSGHVITVTISDGSLSDTSSNSTNITSWSADITSSAKYLVTVTSVDSEGYYTAMSIVRQ